MPRASLPTAPFLLSLLIAAAAVGCDATRDVSEEATAVEGDVAEAVTQKVKLADESEPSADAAPGHARASEHGGGADDHADGEHRKPASNEGPKNLCADYDSCNGCIAGLKADGDSAKAANAKCKLAVTGCWTTWDKPIDCDGEVIDQKPS